MAGDNLIVRLKSVYSGEYLYAGADDLAQDDTRRSVFTWRETNDEVGEWADWKMTGRIVEGKLRVRLASVTYNNELLYVVKGNQKDSSEESGEVKDYLFTPERRHVYTLRTVGVPVPKDGSAGWFLETDDVSQSNKIPNRYALLNAKAKEYLYSPADDFAKDLSRRRVFTWNGDKDEIIQDNNKHLWDIEIISDDD